MRGKKVPIIVIVIPSPRFVSQRARIFRSSRDFLAQREWIFFSLVWGETVWKILDWVEKIRVYSLQENQESDRGHTFEERFQ